MKNMKNIWLILTFLLAWAFPKVHAENTEIGRAHV